jgi:hypothetical protein
MFVRAKVFASLAVLVLGVFLLAPATGALSSIQDKDGADGQGKKDSTVTVTGCLQKGAADGEFSIAGADGTSYQLTSSKVDLKGHVGHKVAVTGKPAKTGAEGSPAAQLEVTNLKVVSATCS